MLAALSKGWIRLWITGLAVGYWASMVLLAANRLNIFGFLSGRPQTAQQLAERCNVHPRPLETSQDWSNADTIGRITGYSSDRH